MPTDKTDTSGDPAEVQSNHNSTAPAKPLPLAQLVGKPDYNPMRAVGTKANDKSDVTLSPDASAALVSEKGDRPEAAEVDTDILGNKLSDVDSVVKDDKPAPDDDKTKG